MPEAAAARQTETLALVFQEILTATVRIRANRQPVNDAESLRSQMREAIKVADQQGRRAGYAPEDIRVALFAVVAFLDESILNSKNPHFSDWPRKPMQEEIFGGHVAGEIFFRNIERLMGTADSDVLADVLEVYLLCLLLGYGGRYSVSGKGEIYSVREQLTERIRRIRGPVGGLSPDWMLPPSDAVVQHSDPWARVLLWTAIAGFVLMVVLFAAFKFSLNGGASQLAAIASQAR